MSTTAYPAPKIPKTPSSTINKMLEARCSKGYENMVKAAVAYYICGFFHVITTIYNAINPDAKRHSHTMWMTACGLISGLIVLKAYLVYNIIMASAFVVHTIIYYGAISLALFGVGLGVSGAVFFDKDGHKIPVTYKEPPKIKVPDMVKSYETGKTTPDPEPTAPSSGPHGVSSSASVDSGDKKTE